jgi:hypothetical protein
MTDRTEPVCSDAGDGQGLGCPACKRFEVRVHPVTCDAHGDHSNLACCWCGEVFFDFNEVEHDDEPPSHKEAIQ